MIPENHSDSCTNAGHVHAHAHAHAQINKHKKVYNNQNKTGINCHGVHKFPQNVECLLFVSCMHLIDCIFI